MSTHPDLAALAELVRLQDAAREARKAHLAAYTAHLDANQAYEVALYTHMGRTGRGKLVYADIEDARVAQSGAATYADIAARAAQQGG